MAPTKEMQNQLPEEDFLLYNIANANKNVSKNRLLSTSNSIDEDKTNITIKGQRPFGLTKQYLVKYGLQKAPIRRLVLSAKVPRKLLANYNNPAKEDISNLGNGYYKKIDNGELYLTLQNLGAIIGIAQSARRGRGKPNNINPKKSEV